MVVAPRGDGVVDVLDRRDPADEEREHSEQERAEEGHCECRRQEQAGHRSAVESPGDEPPGAGCEPTASPTARATSSVGWSVVAGDAVYQRAAKKVTSATPRATRRSARKGIGYAGGSGSSRSAPRFPIRVDEKHSLARQAPPSGRLRRNAMPP